jgi:hypothetical protein
VVNEFSQGRIVQKNSSLIPGGDNSWLDTTYLAAKLSITGPTSLGTKRLIYPKKKSLNSPQLVEGNDSAE